MYQQILLVGRLGNDPEMRYTPSGVPVTSLRLAVNKRWTDTEGKSQEKTTWFSITAWQRLAEIANEYMHKGEQIMVIGEVEEARPYVDRDGNQQASIEIRAQEIKMLGSRSAPNGSDSNGTHAVGESAAEIPL